MDALMASSLPSDADNATGEPLDERMLAELRSNGALEGLPYWNAGALDSPIPPPGRPAWRSVVECESVV
jgi:hypothetical protein